METKTILTRAIYFSTLTTLVERTTSLLQEYPFNAKNEGFCFFRTDLKVLPQELPEYQKFLIVSRCKSNRMEYLLTEVLSSNKSHFN